MERSPLQVLSDELQPIAAKIARERGIITDDQELGVLLRVKPILKPVNSDNPWEVILSLPWAKKQRMVLEELRKHSLRAHQIAALLGKRRYNSGYHVKINRMMVEAGLKHRLKRQRAQYSPGRNVQNASIWMELAKS